jgi:multiple sugar transport system permease protein
MNIKALNISRVAAWIMLILLMLISVIPIWVVLKTALTHPKELFEKAGEFFPSNPTLLNFSRAVGLEDIQKLQEQSINTASLNILSALKNSAIFVLVTVLGQIMFSAMAAYAFARLRFPGREFLFTAILSAMMIPGIVLFIPNFILMKNLGWLDTFQGMIAPYVLMTPFAVFFLRQFFLNIPLELEEAAKLDGATPVFIFWRIVLPLSKAPLATLAILTSINMWNEFFWPYIINSYNNESLRVLPVALQIFRTQTPQGAPDWSGLMAGTFISIIPVFILLIFLGRQVIESLQFSGSK